MCIYICVYRLAKHRLTYDSQSPGKSLSIISLPASSAGH